jgi:hypothetical protein
MRTLPTERRERVEGVELHLVHGSPLGLNDFFWESLPVDAVRTRVDASGADVILCTHSGLPWQRRVGDALVVNVGVAGRPANDGRRDVWYAVLDLAGGKARAELVPLAYDWRAQAGSMRAAGLPEAFTETIETGWWTSCLQILPPTERSRGRFHLYRSELAPGADQDGLGPPVDDDPDRPVVGLFGTALFPRRLSLDGRLDPTTVRTLRHEAERCGFREVGVAPSHGRGSHLIADVDGWYWGAEATEPLAPVSTGLGEVKRRVVETILSRAQADGTLPRPYGCAVAAPP